MKIKDIYSFDYVSDEDNTPLFYFLSDAETYPLVNDFINDDTSLNLSIDYLGGFSSEKYLSPLAQKYWDKYKADGNLAIEEFGEAVAKIIYNRFADKWKKIYDALMTEYNPLENYSMVEERTPDLTIDETENEKSDVKTSRETSASNKYKGFNNSEPVLLNTTDGTEDVETSGAKLDNEVSKKTTHTGTETLTRAGNIGVTTSQAMLQAEIEVRKNDFYKLIYKDIDTILCLSVY